ncbi:hypothetical protein SAMN05877838_1489 [Hoeflea halophila]|uniref:DUF1178 family protein n=1 Tax=Hoeflea halophila TaxID=714899 RepID=A0A286I971_9HYPH|nr:DUF1178 family protein [Hoeflea halophila]SOE16611.1 hypothetical protein SAMN05877838_1489 [Hoeflea halophila]
MIRFSLHCDKEHEFEAWFSSSKDFDGQAERGLVECPICGSRQIGKSLMAPAVTVSRDTSARPLAMDPERREMMRKLREMVQAVRQNSEDVGDRFADEARKIHHGEAEARGIIGKATADDAKSLIEDGIDIAPLPELPDDLS